MLANRQVTNELRFCDDQEAVGALTYIQNSSEEQLVVTHPNTWLSAGEHAPDHSFRVVGIEAADSIESRVAANLRTLSHVAVHKNSSRVVVHGSSRATPRIALCEPMAPHTAEVHDGNSHVLSAFQPAIVISFRVQLLLQIVNVGHQSGIGTA